MNKNNYRKKERPTFPSKAIVTAGMPYGNKSLHFGHVGGLFIHADVYARFLRDRIGQENVIFVSGTDCYGSPILASYNKALAESAFDGTLIDYVTYYHHDQKKTLEDFDIQLNLYGASALGTSGNFHTQLSEDIAKELYAKGCLKKLSHPQFYDPAMNQFLNGRQVIGKCPISGCQSDKAYADECSLGHQYMPEDLLDPISTLSGTTPVLKEVSNWYFDLETYRESISEYIQDAKAHSTIRPYVAQTMEEFLKSPIIYVKKSEVSDIDQLMRKLPPCQCDESNQKASHTLIFTNLSDRDKAKDILHNEQISFRTGKTLVPFRLSGNCHWGITFPTIEGLDDLTFWVWPESLWAPISFTKAYLSERNIDESSWSDWWFGEDSQVYQFIGEDNIYFYGIAEMGLLKALYDKQDDGLEPKHLPRVIANNHVLFMDKKASSSSEIKPPLAKELLEHYTADQLRMHFLSLGLAKKSVSFTPQAFLSSEEQIGHDPVLKDGNLLTNVFNRLLRSLFYTSEKYYDWHVPEVDVSPEILDLTEKALFDYERYMHDQEFHRVIYVLDELIRKMNKYWVNNMRTVESSSNHALRDQVMADILYAIKTILLLLHPITPTSCELVRDYLNMNEDMWDWSLISAPLTAFYKKDVTLTLKPIPPKYDFFKKLESQYK